MAIVNWPDLHGEFFHGQRALITGGAGFIGSHLTEALIDLGATAVVLDDLSGGDTGNFATFKDRTGSRLNFIEGSILDTQVLADSMADCDVVFHLAALGSVPRSIEEPVLYQQVNADGTLNVLEASRAAGVRRVVFSASSSAYGDSPTLPKIETMPILAKSPYAATKAACESLMRAYGASYDIDTVSLRYFNIFGPRQNANSAYAAVIAAFAKALLNDEKPLIYGDGTQSRDFTFVDNAVHANLLAARQQEPLAGAVLNVACGLCVTVNELADAMARMLGKDDLPATYVEMRAGDVMHSLADMALTDKTLGYQPIVAFEPGLDATVKWYEAQIG
jgi:nucleoside-diphosphate-sugar epimerase